MKYRSVWRLLMEMKHTSLVVENLEVASNGRGNK